MKKIIAGMALAALTPLTLAATTVDAHAETTRNYSLQTPYNGNGSGKASGSIRFVGGLQEIHGTLYDFCPADGAGIVLRFIPKNNNNVQSGEDLKLRFTGGCGEGISYDYIAYPYEGRTTTDMVVRVCEQDGDKAPRDCVSQSYSR